MTNDNDMGTPLLYDTLNEYLSPLLEKHADGKLLTYDDLVSSFDKAQRVVKKNIAAPDVMSVNVHLTKLHKSQLDAYGSAARKAILDYTNKWKLPPIEIIDQQKPKNQQKLESIGEYGKRCVDAMKSSPDRPTGWHVSYDVWLECCFDKIQIRSAQEHLNLRKKVGEPKNVIETSASTEDNGDMATQDSNSQQEGKHEVKMDVDTAKDDDGSNNKDVVNENKEKSPGQTKATSKTEPKPTSTASSASKSTTIVSLTGNNRKVAIKKKAATALRSLTKTRGGSSNGGSNNAGKTKPVSAAKPTMKKLTSPQLQKGKNNTANNNNRVGGSTKKVVRRGRGGGANRDNGKA